MNGRRHYRLTALGRLLPLRWFPWLLAVVVMLLSVPRGAYERLSQSAGMASLFSDDPHQKQHAFIADKAKIKSALTGRRAGKTQGIARWLYLGMLDMPGERSVFIAVSASKARQILWDGCFGRMRRTHGLPVTLTSRTGQLMVEHPNGSSIWLAGCNDKSELDKFRGERYRRVCIDEAQAYPSFLKELVESALEPALSDLRGELAMTGTPPPSFAPDDYFYLATTGQLPGVTSHHWTVLDNPHFFEPSNYLAEKRARSGWNEEHPTYRREYLGQWVQDENAIIYPFGANNYWQPEEADDSPYGLPVGEYRYGLGVDLGFGEGSTAFCLCALRVGTGEVYVLSCYTRSRLVPNAIAAHVQAVRERLRVLTGGEQLAVVVDEGALGKGFAEQMRMLGVYCEPAQKSEKRAYQEYVRGFILSGAVKVDVANTRDLIAESRRLQFDPETGLEDERYTRHCCDSLLYIVRKLRPRYDPETNPPEPGSKEALRLEQKRMKEETWKRIEKRRKGEA